jgi:hypothetical protein
VLDQFKGFRAERPPKVQFNRPFLSQPPYSHRQQPSLNGAWIASRPMEQIPARRITEAELIAIEPHEDLGLRQMAGAELREAARKLNQLRVNWLNPSDIVQEIPECVPGFPSRLIPVDVKAAQELRKRSLTNLYNERPTWLNDAHRDLDAAVAAAYGWPAGIPDDEVLQALLAWNLERAGTEENGSEDQAPDEAEED